MRHSTPGAGAELNWPEPSSGGIRSPGPRVHVSWPLGAAHVSTATIMFAANLTLGLYVQLGPRSQSANGTVGLEGMFLEATEQPPATPPSYLTLVPLLATMVFIMGRCHRGLSGAGVTVLMWLGEGR